MKPMHKTPTHRSSVQLKVQACRPKSVGRRTLACRSTSRAQFSELQGGAWVVHTNRRPQGIVHFIGGAFAGAAPQALYNLFLNLLAQEGFTVITTPYHVTFRHTDTAQELHQVFQDGVQELRRSGQGHLVPQEAPTFGVGHSNGALMHLFIGSLQERVYDANVVISYNNRQVSDAIPIPGLLEGLGPAVQAGRQLPFPAPISLQAVAQAFFTQAAAVVPPTVLDARLVASATGTLEQLGTVVNEIGDGICDFTPTPQESRSIIRERYRVPRTLLVRFADDSIDETPEMARLLLQANPRGVLEVLLPGSHVTPVGTDLNWKVAGSFTPLDAMALGAKVVVQRDVRRLVGRVAQYLEPLSTELQPVQPAAQPGVRAAELVEVKESALGGVEVVREEVDRLVAARREW